MKECREWENKAVIQSIPSASIARRSTTQYGPKDTGRRVGQVNVTFVARKRVSAMCRIGTGREARNHQHLVF